MYAILTDAETRVKYRVDACPDRAFAKMFVLAMREDKPLRMSRALEGLTRHVHRKWGGFNLDGWKCRAPLGV